MTDVDTTTPNLGLIKPSFDGRADVRELNQDMDILDAFAGTLDGAVINPMVGPGDLIAGGAAGTPTRLAAGSEGQVLKMVGGAPIWTVVPPDVGFQNPMTSPGDLIRGGTAGACTAVAGGGVPQQVHVERGEQGRQAPMPGAMTHPMPVHGDLARRGAGGTAGQLAVGVGGHVLSVVGGVAAWAAQ